MANIYFNPAAGDADGSYGNLNNFFNDSGSTTPAARVPNSADTCIMQGEASTGSLSCNVLTGASQVVSGDASITAVTSVAAITWSSSASITSPSISGCIFNSTPGAAVIGSGNSYQANMSIAITASGVSTFGSFTFSGAVVISGTPTVTTATFSGSVTATCNLSGGIFSGTTSMAGFAFTGEITGGTLLCSSFTGTHTAGAITLTGPTANYAPASRVAGTAVFSDTPTRITSQAVSYAGLIVNTALPAVAQVLTTGGSWGIGGTGSTGTATVPAAGNVKTGVSYGVGGNGSAGTLQPGGPEAIGAIGIGL